MKKIHLTESQINNLITERISNNVYHYTSIHTILKISEEDTIYLQSALAGSANSSDNGKLFYLSTTRTKYQGFGYSNKFSNNAARIEFDGDKLNNVFKAKPYHYWTPDLGKYSYLSDNSGLTKSKQIHTRDEAEDRLFSNNSSIEPAHKYIKRIDIIMTDISDKTDENYINISNILMGKYRKLVFVYDNLNDFNKQNNNTINKEITDDFSTFRKGVYDYDDLRSNGDLINLVLAAILKGESNNPKQDSAKLLKQYGLEKYLKNGLLKDNDYMRNTSYNDMAGMLSYKLETPSRNPNRERSKILQMLTDYFIKNKIKNYSDFVKHKSFNTELNNYYETVNYYVNKYIVDPNKKINALLITNTNTYDKIIVTNVNDIKVSDINNDIEYVAYNFIYLTEENMKSKDYSSYEKYILGIFKKNPTLGTIINMLKQLGYQDNIYQMLKDILDTKIQKETLNVYSLSDDMVMPQCMHNKKYNIAKFLELFKK